ncbi:hypothetical protein ScPMuIL_002806 [Solemya velum]
MNEKHTPDTQEVEGAFLKGGGGGGLNVDFGAGHGSSEELCLDNMTNSCMSPLHIHECVLRFLTNVDVHTSVPERRGVEEETIQRMEADEIDVNAINVMTDGDLEEYLPCRGDRMVVKAYARQTITDADMDVRRSALVSSLKSRMGISRSTTSDIDEDDTNVTKKEKKLFSYCLRFTRKKNKQNQATEASKNDHALVVGFVVFDPSSNKYRQIRAPMGGGIRHYRVEKSTKKPELLTIIPLFFPDGKNSHKTVANFIFDISTDVRGPRIMQDASIDDVIERLGLKHFRCYLLAKRQSVSYDANSPEGTKRLPMLSDCCQESDLLSNNEMFENEFAVASLDVETSVNQEEILFFSTVNSDSKYGTTEIDPAGSNQSVLVEYNTDTLFPPTYISQVEGMPTESLTEDIPTTNESDDSGVIQFGRLSSDVLHNCSQRTCMS